MGTTVDYYNKNAGAFYESTVTVDMGNLYEKFEFYLSERADILDCGCGSGRDSKHFVEQGYNVTAFDASEELCKFARDLTGLEVKCMSFQEISYKNEFDGIWACASILHAEKAELPEILRKLRDALKPEGILYVSFKYGDYEGARNGRYFIDLTEERMVRILSEVPGLSILETWITGDVREGRASELWLNMLLKADNL